MKSIVTTTFFTLGLVLTAGVQTAAADSLSVLNSACRTGDYAACSRYNAAILAQRGEQSRVLFQGYDPFAIQPATARTPSQPANNAADIAVGKSAPELGEAKKTQ